MQNYFLQIDILSSRFLLVLLSMFLFFINLIVYFRKRDIDLFCSLMILPCVFYIYEVNQLLCSLGKPLKIIDVLKIIYCCIIYLCLFLPKLVQKFHKKISFFLIINILSGLLIFSPQEPFNLNFYIIFLYLILLIVLVSYELSRNKSFYFNMLPILFINFGMYLVRLYIEDYRIVWDIQDIFYLVFAVITTFLFIYSLFVNISSKRKISTLTTNLFYERDKDLDLLIDYLNRFNSIGINACWGNGKSFLYKMIQKDQRTIDDYYFITISVMSITIDSAETFIVNEINKVLEENRIFSFVSEKFQWLQNHNIFHDMGTILFGHNSYTSLIQDLGNCVNRMPDNKTIVITFEDIDRLSSKEDINKIFSISDSLINICKLKIIFQYDEKKLLEKLEEEKTYLEKFIPYTMNLTAIPLKRMIEEKLKTEDYKNLEKTDFNFLFNSYQIPDFIQCDFKSAQLDIDSFIYQIRIVEIFLEEINLAFNRESYKSYNDYKKIIILFYFVKHFDHSLFNELGEHSLFIDKCCFNFDYEKYKIYEILNNILEEEYVPELFNNDQNKRYLGYLILLGFDLSLFIKGNNKTHKAATNITLKKADDLEKKLHNEKINLLIQNLYANGKTEYTGFEKLVSGMNDILKRKENRIEMFDKFIMNVDIKNIISSYEDYFIPIFKAYNIYETDCNNWIELLNFYFDEYNSKGLKLTTELISIFSLIKFSDKKYKKLYLKTLEYFNSDKIEICCNFKDSQEYNNFIIHYFEGLLWGGYFYEDWEWRFEHDPYFFGSKIIITLQSLINQCNSFINELRNNKIEDNLLKQELYLIIGFLEKNIKIKQSQISNEKTYFKNKTTITETTETEEIIKKYKELDVKEVPNKLQNDYNHGVITSLQYKSIIHEIFDKQTDGDY